jgi:hypothetical protein
MRSCREKSLVVRHLLCYVIGSPSQAAVPPEAGAKGTISGHAKEGAVMDNGGYEMIPCDIRGQICPSSLLIALKEINRHKERLRTGEVALLFKTDNRDATVTIPDAAENMGYGTKVVKEADYYLITVDNGA